MSNIADGTVTLDAAEIIYKLGYLDGEQVGVEKALRVIGELDIDWIDDLAMATMLGIARLRLEDATG